MDKRWIRTSLIDSPLYWLGLGNLRECDEYFSSECIFKGLLGYMITWWILYLARSLWIHIMDTHYGYTSFRYICTLNSVVIFSPSALASMRRLSGIIQPLVFFQNAFKSYIPSFLESLGPWEHSFENQWTEVFLYHTVIRRMNSRDCVHSISNISCFSEHQDILQSSQFFNFEKRS